MSFPPFLTTERIEKHESEGHWPSPGIADLLAHRAKQTPSAVFIVDADQRLSFADFARRVDALAAGFLGLGITPGQVVSWQLPSWWEGAAIAVALDRIGAVGNPIIPIYREREVAFIVRQAQARALIVPGVLRSTDHRELAQAVRRAAPSLEHIITVRAEPGDGMIGLERLLGSGPIPPASPRGPHDVTMLFYTSGTTSEPKGVMHTASTLGAFARTNALMSGADSDTVSLLQFPLTHIGGIGAFLVLPILLGSRVVYLDVWDPERALALIEGEGVTSAGGPPAILQAILACKGFHPRRVRTVKVAGSGAADISPELIHEIRRRFGARSFRSYGLTECPMLTCAGPDDSEDECALTDGRPSPGCTVRVVGERHPLPPDTEGEIEAFGPQLFVGYLDEQLNDAAFTADGFLRTGDLGILDGQDHLRVTGRKKDIIIRKGENLSAKAIEDVLHQHPAIAETAVVGAPDPVSGERVCACVVLRDPGGHLTLEDIRRFMEQKQVMRQKIPEQLLVLPSLPRNATGKVLKHELKKQLA